MKWRRIKVVGQATDGAEHAHLVVVFGSRHPLDLEDCICVVWTATTKGWEEHGRFKGLCESLHHRSEANVHNGTRERLPSLPSSGQIIATMKESTRVSRCVRKSFGVVRFSISHS